MENPREHIVLIPYTPFWALLKSYNSTIKMIGGKITYKRLSTEFGRLLNEAMVGRASTYILLREDSFQNDILAF